MVSLRVALLLGAIMAASALRADDDKVAGLFGAVGSDKQAQEELEVATAVEKFIAMMNERTRKIGKLEIWGIASCPFYQGESEKASTHMGLLGINSTIPASPDLMNLGLVSVALPVRRSTFSLISLNLHAI